MNRLASILPAAQVLVSVDVTSKKRAFEEAGLLFESLHGLSRALITDSLFARERLGSTGLGHGVAIPHGRIKGLTAPMAAVFQLASPIGFDAPDEQPVGLLAYGVGVGMLVGGILGNIASQVRQRISNPTLTVVARAHSDAGVRHLLEHGADGAVMAERELAHSLAEMVLATPDYRGSRHLPPATL